MKRRWLTGVLLSVLLVGGWFTAAVNGQGPYSAQIQAAIQALPPEQRCGLRELDLHGDVHRIRRHTLIDHGDDHLTTDRVSERPHR